MTTKWKLDLSHSDITFKVRHMMISNVKGNFTDFDVQLESEDENFSQAKAVVTIQTNSLSTYNADRDNHLKSADFLHVEVNPIITFETDNLDNPASGKLTINGITKKITLDISFNGTEVDPYGKTRAGFSVEGKINRKDFGLTWNAALETGGLLIGEDVKITGELQFIKEG